MEPGRREGEDVPEFQLILDQSVEEGLRYVLGESGLQMVLSLHPLQTLSSDPARFHEAMTEIFMPDGAAVIEREIARRLLQKAGREQKGGRGRPSWLAAALSGRSSGRVSETEKRALRRFVAFAALPQGHRTDPSPPRRRAEAKTGSIELTSSRFAAAFKKGS